MTGAREIPRDILHAAYAVNLGSGNGDTVPVVNSGSDCDLAKRIPRRAVVNTQIATLFARGKVERSTNDIAGLLEMRCRGRLRAGSRRHSSLWEFDIGAPAAKYCRISTPNFPCRHDRERLNDGTRFKDAVVTKRHAQGNSGRSTDRCAIADSNRRGNVGDG